MKVNQEVIDELHRSVDIDAMDFEFRNATEFETPGLVLVTDADPWDVASALGRYLAYGYDDGDATERLAYELVADHLLTTKPRDMTFQTYFWPGIEIVED